MPKCCVSGCESEADVEVILYDVYLVPRKVFFERDFTCPFLCLGHAIENEKKAKGERRPGSCCSYPYTNQHDANGFSVYRPLAFYATQESQDQDERFFGVGKEES